MKWIALLLVGVVLMLGVAAISGTQQSVTTPTPTPSIEDTGILFDDFDYTAHDDPQLAEHGWIVREGGGWPGVQGASFSPENVSFVDDPDSAGNTLMQMTSSTDGTASGTKQTQVCQQRKFYEGTYASRVKFTDTPAQGPDGDGVLETFYMISPFVRDLDPDYSEMDFEYLPNGGWGETGNMFWWTTWETFQFEPWYADNHSDRVMSSFEGWHTLVLNAADDTVTYFVDGEQMASHGGRYFPEVPMSLNYNLWFIDGGTLASPETREYVEQIDWAYHAVDAVFTPTEVEAQVEGLRDAETAYVNTVSDWTPPLVSPCNM